MLVAAVTPGRVPVQDSQAFGHAQEDTLMIVVVPILLLLCVGTLVWGFRTKRVWLALLPAALAGAVGGWLIYQIVLVEMHNDRERRAWPHYERAKTLVEANDRAGALAELNEALAVQPTLFQAYLLRGEVRQQEGELEAALADFTRAIEQVPPTARHAEGAVAHLERGKCLAKAGRAAEAEQDFKQALEAGGPGLRSAVDDARKQIKQP
jgi:tetratricopeptide (TPR) repeat protein